MREPTAFADAPARVRTRQQFRRGVDAGLACGHALQTTSVHGAVLIQVVLPGEQRRSYLAGHLPPRREGQGLYI